MSLRIYFILVIKMICHSCVEAQTLHELPPLKKVKEAKSMISYDFMGVELDKNGNPKLAGKFGSFSKTIFKDGLPDTLTLFDWSNHSKKQMEFIYSIQNNQRHKVVINSLYGKKVKKFKWYQVFYKDDLISHENIYYGDKELKATVNYNHFVDDKGNRIVKADMFKPEVEGKYGGFDFVYNRDGIMVEKTAYVNQDTGVIFKVLESYGDSLYISSFSTLDNEGSRQDATYIKLDRYDNKGNLIYTESKIEGINPQTGKAEKGIGLGIHLYDYSDFKMNTQLEIQGSFVNEKENILLSLSKDGTCLISFFNTEAHQIDSPVALEGWEYLLANKEKCKYYPKEEQIQFESIKGRISAKSILNSIELSSANSEFKVIFLDRLE